MPRYSNHTAFLCLSQVRNFWLLYVLFRFLLKFIVLLLEYKWTFVFAVLGNNNILGQAAACPVMWGFPRQSLKINEWPLTNIFFYPGGVAVSLFTTPILAIFAISSSISTILVFIYCIAQCLSVIFSLHLICISDNFSSFPYHIMKLFLMIIWLMPLAEQGMTTRLKHPVVTSLFG